MIDPPGSAPARARPGVWMALVLAASLSGGEAEAQSGFPSVSLWSYAGAYQAGPDSIREQPRTLTMRWMRDPDAEARPDFAGYRIYRVYNEPDTSRMVLVRRFSRNAGNTEDSLFLWHFPPISQATPLVNRIATFVDPDSSGNFQKRCRRYNDQGLCITPGDSIFVLVPPPGPHNGFRTWYSITYEAKNTLGNDFLDLFIPDTITCSNPDRSQCPNLNNKARNLTAAVIEPTPGPKANLEGVSVVPNPFRAREAWDGSGNHEVHFVNLPSQARITIYTASGDKVAEFDHNDPTRDFARWNLKNQNGQDVTSGIYMYRVVSGAFSSQNRFIVIR